MPSMTGGGAERVLLNLLNQLDLTDTEVHLFLGLKKGELLSEIPENIVVETIFPNQLAERISFYVLRWLGVDSLIRFFGKRIQGHYSAGLCFLDGIYTEFLCLDQLNVDKRITVIHSSYKSYLNKFKFIKGSYKKRMINRYRKMNKIISVAKEAKDEFCQLFQEENFAVEVIYNPMNKKDILTKSQQSPIIKFAENKLNIIAVGSLFPVKGFDFLIDTLAKIKDLDFHLYIIGEGFLKAQLEEQIVALNMSNHVSLVGFVSNPYPEINNADLFIMSSLAEGLPTVLCEAMILGVPTLTPNVPGCREVTEYGKFGMMYDRTEEDLIAAIRAIFKERKVLGRYALESKKRAAIFDDAIVVEKYQRVLNLN